MIVGLTNDAETKTLIRTTRFKGKISAGYAPNEPPNNTNSPKPSGFYRILKQVQITKREGGKTFQIQQWVLNDDIQKKLIAENAGNENPRRVSGMFLYKTPEENWESYLGKYSSTEGLLCKSYGAGTVPTEVVYNEKGERIRRPRLFSGKAECPYEQCPDYQKGVCKECGLLKVFPFVDLQPMPYQFTTRSINSIMAINTAIHEIYSLIEAAHGFFEKETGKKLKFKGLEGVKYCLVHRKIKSGGREVFITQLEPASDIGNTVMSVIRRGIESSQQGMLTGTVGMVDLLEKPEKEDDGEVPSIEAPSEALTEGEEKGIATEFKADAAQGAPDAKINEAGKALLNQHKKH